MYLGPHHFQAQARYFEDTIHFAASSLWFAGYGLAACELDVEAPAVVRRALLEQRLVLNATGPTTLRLLPPLTIGAQDIDEALRRLRAALEG